MAKKRRPPVAARFKVGDRVRVKRGIRDTDHLDMPLGGWAGTISEDHKDGMAVQLGGAVGNGDKHEENHTCSADHSL